MIYSYNNREYIETLEADVTYASARKVNARWFSGLGEYEYYLHLKNVKGVRKIKVSYEVFRAFLGRTGVVIIEKYKRSGVGYYDYEVVSWTVNTPES